MKNIVINNYVNVLIDPNNRFKAEKLTLLSGIRSDLKGSKFLIDSTILYGTDSSTAFCEIYDIVGKYRNVKPKTLMRAISYSLAQSFSIAERLSALVGVNIPSSDIHSGLVIAYLGRLFKNPALAACNIQELISMPDTDKKISR